MTCRMCGVGFCPYCAPPSRRVSVHTGHRVSFEDSRRAQESGPIRSAQAHRLPSESLRPDQQTSGPHSPEVDLNSVVHAPEATGARLADVPELLFTQPEIERGNVSNDR